MIKSPKSITLHVVENIPFIKKGDNLGTIIADCIKHQDFSISDGDIFVIAHKIVSRAENRLTPLDKIIPSSKAKKLATKTERDPRLCQLILEQGRILYRNGRAIITEDKLGIVNTSAGIDRSNSGSKEGEMAVLLPKDPDSSAQKIRKTFKKLTKKSVAVIISDSLGRPWRKGAVGMAIGFAGIKAVEEGEKKDLSGRIINPEIALVDQVASAASILMGQTDEGYPVVVVRGINYTPSENVKLKDILRPAHEDQVWK